jgi:GntR family transcriptional regulator/MocR family aminotransferase
MRDWLLQIKRGEYASLQTQIREAFVSAILDGQLGRDEPVPSTRKMAKVLGVSRNTVMLSYQGLLDDGYLVARERSGYYVSDKAIPQQAKRLAPSQTEKKSDYNAPDWQARFARHPGNLENISKPLDWSSYKYPFIYGQVDHNLFPIAEWRECARQTLGKRWFNAWTDDHGAHDDALLVEQIRRRILPRRGIMAAENEILVTLGAQHALYMISSLLAKSNTKVVVEDPGFPDARNIFSLHTNDVHLQPIDSQGIVPDTIPDATQMVFVTPSHQAPTTVTMPLTRRLELMELARKKDFLIIEDDHEFETNYVNEPCPSLKSLDDDGHVIYIGSLSKSVFHGLRLGFLVAPKAFIDEARALRRLMVRHPPNNNQRTAALFLSLGHHDTLIRRLHRAYRARWEIMATALKTHLPDSTRVPSFGGTSFWVEGPKGLDSERLAEAGREQGLLIEPGRIFFGTPNPPRNYFRLGFSSIDESRIEPGIELLAKLIKEDLKIARQAAEQAI